MILLTTVEDRLALEIGSQVVARHKLEVEADALRRRIVELEAEGATQSPAPDQKTATSST